MAQHPRLKGRKEEGRRVMIGCATGEREREREKERKREREREREKEREMEQTTKVFLGKLAFKSQIIITIFSGANWHLPEPKKWHI